MRLRRFPPVSGTCLVPIFVDTKTSMLNNNETGGPVLSEYVKHRRKYDREFKVQTVKFSLESGKTVNEVAEDFGICPGNLTKWRRKYK